MIIATWLAKLLRKSTDKRERGGEKGGKDINSPFVSNWKKKFNQHQLMETDDAECNISSSYGCSPSVNRFEWSIDANRMCADISIADLHLLPFPLHCPRFRFLGRYCTFLYNISLRLLRNWNWVCSCYPEWWRYLSATDLVAINQFLMGTIQRSFNGFWWLWNLKLRPDLFQCCPSRKWNTSSFDGHVINLKRPDQPPPPARLISLLPRKRTISFMWFYSWLEFD